MAEKEYIERGAVEKFVSSVRRDLPLESPDFITRDYMLLNFEQLIHLMPAADVVEVVRCKDCKHYAGQPDGCMLLRTCVHENFYCEYGEREEIDNG